MSVHLQQIQVTALLFFVDTRSEQIVIGATVQFYLVAILWPKAQMPLISVEITFKDFKRRKIDDRRVIYYRYTIDRVIFYRYIIDWCYTIDKWYCQNRIHGTGDRKWKNMLAWAHGWQNMLAWVGEHEIAVRQRALSKAFRSRRLPRTSIITL